MRITFETDGGFAAIPGLNRPTTIDTTTLPTEDAAVLERAVHDADFFARPAPRRAAPEGAADYREYTITIADAAAHRTLHLTDPIGDPTLVALVGHLRAAARGNRGT